MNLFSLDKILFPINDDNVHWFLAEIDLRVITYMIVMESAITVSAAAAPG